MQFHAKFVEASAAGDYFQLSFDSEEEEGEAHLSQEFEEFAPYVLLQRQFEFVDGGKCYIESDDQDYIGHFHARLTELTPTRLVFELRRRQNSHIEISYSLTDSEFADFRSIRRSFSG